MLKRLMLVVMALFTLIIIVSYFIIQNETKNKVYKNVNSIPKNKVGVVLGTSKKLSNGNINLYFKYRIEATVALFNKGKIKYILVSGDHGTKNYNEPEDFKKELIKKGIPESKIYLDYAGFRTLDSVIRAYKVFGQNSFTVISQDFHNRRAIYIANLNGLNVVGFNARDVDKKYGFKVYLREYLARTKVFVDVLLNIQPKFLGPKIEIK